MSNVNLKPSDRAALAGIINPASQGAGSVSSGWVSMADYECVMAMVIAGTLGASATLDAKLEQAKDNSGTDAKDIAGKAITQLTDAGGDSDKQAVINCWAEDLDINNSYSHVRLTLTVGTAASVVSGSIMGMNARYQPPTAISSLAEVV